ncbi:MAG: hypothetical protein GWM98_08230, partial [Nitrospinaceae bacterium]|nr:hypothetical protein [Nitrospinaceae bacterium]NIT81719.1 hypothetical protein [Nitrospinaceae bacterium]NIY14875.1 hypothetical protein [Nitrospinaceae bacterium]
MYESNRLFHLLLVMATALLWAAPVETEAAHHESDKTTVEDVKKEAGETYTTLKRFTIQQRDEALAIAEQKLDRLDGRIARTEKKLEKGWQDMTLAAYRHQQETLASLRK